MFSPTISAKEMRFSDVLTFTEGAAAGRADRTSFAKGESTGQAFGGGYSKVTLKGSVYVF
jgi:hypothetical protein